MSIGVGKYGEGDEIQSVMGNDLELDITKAELGTVIQGLSDTTVTQSHRTKLYIPLIKEFIAQPRSNSSMSFTEDRKLGKQIFRFIEKTLKLDRELVLADVNHALVNINIDDFDLNEKVKQKEFLCQYLSFFLSLQNYLTYNENEQHKFSRLASPPKEAYIYEGHSPRIKSGSRSNYALMFED